MSNVFTATVAIDLVGVGGISSGDYSVDWWVFTPWFSAGELYNFTPDAVAFEGFDVGHGWFDPMNFSDMPAGFMVSSPSWVIATSGVSSEFPSGPLTPISNDGSHIAVEFDFNDIYAEGPGVPALEIDAAYNWILPNHGFYLTAVVSFAPGGATSFPSVEVAKSGFQLHDSTLGVDITSAGTPVVMTRTSGNTRYFMFPFTVGGSAPPPDSAFWTNFVSCVEDV